MENVIEAKALTKTFKDFWHRPKAKAVKEIDFEIKKGEVFGLLGPNGSGKSTTIKLILGLLHPTSGSLKVLGSSPREVKTKSRIGYLPEESYLYPYLTSRETLGFYGKLFDLSAAERKKRIDQLLEMVGLNHTKQRTVKEFSKGMARRVGLAQALINDPELIILDEPTSGLDPIGCRQIKDLILALAKRGKTVILSSHLLADVEDVCDRAAILYGGEIHAMGAMDELLTEKTRTQIMLPEMDHAAQTALLETIRSKTDSQAEVIHPSMSLEEFFLDIVKKADEAGIQSSGAQSTETVADYLSSDQTPAPKDDLLDQLSKADDQPTVASEKSEADEKTESAAPSKELDSKLDRLLNKNDSSNNE